MTTIQCPACGKTLQIPEELSEFSCVYCGHRMKKPEAAVPPEDGKEALARAKAAIITCIAGKRELRQEIKKDQYDRSFQAYEALCAPIFEDLDAAYGADSACLPNFVSDFIDQMEAEWKKEPSSGKKKIAQDDDKITIAIFLVPAVRHLALAVSEPFCAALREEWLRRYPQNVFNIGSYEEISGGFRKKILGLCFITTAVCRQEGKQDDCEELTAFRRFRDGYLRGCPDGPALIAEYYETAPAIVTMLELCGDGAQVYEEIRQRWLNPCETALRQGREADCKACYTQMVRTLQAQYLQ